MTIFSDVENRIIDEKYIQALKDDNIDVKHDVIQKAKEGDVQAIYTIGCIYAAKKERDMAIVWLGTSSAMEYHKSQIEIGIMFENLKFYENAIEWYTQARTNGIICGDAHIGDVYYKQNKPNEAEEQYKKAATRGDPYGQTRLGVYYRSLSHLGNKNLDTIAIGYLHKSAEQNYPQGQYDLAYMYENGCGTDVDKYKALMWYQKSKTGGYEPAGVRINNLNKQGYFHIPHSTYYLLNNTHELFLDLLIVKSPH